MMNPARPLGRDNNVRILPTMQASFCVCDVPHRIDSCIQRQRERTGERDWGPEYTNTLWTPPMTFGFFGEPALSARYGVYPGTRYHLGRLYRLARLIRSDFKPFPAISVSKKGE